MILSYQKEHNLPKLNEELAQLEFLKPIVGEKETDGITPVAFIKSNDDNIELRIEKELTQQQIEMITQVMNNHNPTLLKKPTAEERLEALELAMLEVVLGG